MKDGVSVYVKHYTNRGIKPDRCVQSLSINIFKTNNKPNDIINAVHWFANLGECQSRVYQEINKESR